MTKITYIPGEIANAAVDEHGNRKPVTRTQHIFDDAKDKNQAEVNAEVDDTFAFHQSEINALNSQNYVTVDSFSSLPATGAVDTVYRVSNWDGIQQDPSVYSEYAWNGEDYVHLSTKTQIGEIFDISAYHATGGELAKYADLAAALGTNGANIPQSLQKGGMSIKFVQSSDNKYVQYRLASTTWSTDIHDWTSEDPYFIDKIMQEVNEAIDEHTPIEIHGDVTNAPDEEDLTSVNVGGTDVLKFKDKAYNSLTYSGLGRKILRKNIVNGVNTLTQDMMSDANTIYIIQYDFVLGENITVPANCVLEFDGGSLNDGTIIFQRTIITGAEPCILCNFGGSIDGEIVLDWFGKSLNDYAPVINNVEGGSTIRLLPDREYPIRTDVYLKADVLLIGDSNSVLEVYSSTIHIGYGNRLSGFTVFIKEFTNNTDDVLSCFEISEPYVQTSRIALNKPFDRAITNTKICIDHICFSTPAGTNFNDNNTAVMKITGDGTTTDHGIWGINVSDCRLTAYVTYGFYHLKGGENAWVNSINYFGCHLVGQDYFFYTNGIGVISINTCYTQTDTMHTKAHLYARNVSGSISLINCQFWDCHAMPTGTYAIDCDSSTGNISIINTRDYLTYRKNDLPGNLYINNHFRNYLLLDDFIELLDGRSVYTAAQILHLSEGYYTVTESQISRFGIGVNNQRFLLEVRGQQSTKLVRLIPINNPWTINNGTYYIYVLNYLVGSVDGQLVPIGGSSDYNLYPAAWRIEEASSLAWNSCYGDVTIFNKIKDFNNIQGKTFYCVDYRNLLIKGASGYTDYKGFTPARTSGNRTQRPAADFSAGSINGFLKSTDLGFQYYDTDLKKPIFWGGMRWLDATGGAVTYAFYTQLNHVTLSNYQSQEPGATYSTTIYAEEGYLLPDDISVNIGGSQLVKDTGYTYQLNASKTQAELTLLVTATGTMTIIIAAVTDG